MKKALAFPIVFVLLVASLAFFVNSGNEDANKKEADCYFGVSFCGNTTKEAMLLIDKVKDYTNVLIVQSGPVSWNETATNEVCHYAVEAGLDIIVYFGDLSPRAFDSILEEKGIDLYWRLDWIATAKEKYGDNFLGVYYYDESGGIWLDKIEESNSTSWFVDPTYDQIAELFTAFLSRDQGFRALQNNSINVFSSDYALYWWDYIMGYDTILAQLGWNHTIEQDIGLLRGAATMQNKSWGTIITWKYFQEPYLDTPENVYKQMQMSYDAGADYIIVFNYPYLEDDGYGTITDAHFEAMETFWNTVVTNASTQCGQTPAEVALVLPESYGWGMRRPDDIIWGMFDADEKSEQIWNISRQLIDQHGIALDIIYEDPMFPDTSMYPKIVYWNQTTTPNP